MASVRKVAVAITIAFVCVFGAAVSGQKGPEVSSAGLEDVASGRQSAVCPGTMSEGFVLQERILVELNRAGSASFRTVWRVDAKTGALGPPVTERRSADRADLSESGQERWLRKGQGKTERLELLIVLCPNPGALQKSLDLLLSMYSAVPVQLAKPSVGDRTSVYEAADGTSIGIVATKGTSLCRIYLSSHSLEPNALRALAEDLARRAVADGPVPQALPAE